MQLRMALAVACLLSVCVVGCAPRQGNCERSANAQIAFSSPQDEVSVRTLGENCAQAVGVMSIASQEGHVLWAWAAPLHPTFGNLFEARADGPSARDAEEFLSRWAQVRAVTTGEAPPWPQSAQTPLGGAITTLDRATYEDLRARRLPMACALTGVARETCVFYEPAAAAAAVLVERDVAAEAAEPAAH